MPNPIATLDAIHLEAIQLDYLRLIEPRLTPVKDGSGQGRGGLPNGWITGLSMARLHPSDCPMSFFEAFLKLRDYICEIDETLVFDQIMINKLEGNTQLATHIDGAVPVMRYHLPIFTNPDVFYYEEGHRHHFQAGTWYGPISFTKPHSMINGGNAARIHIVIDVRNGA